MKVTRSTHQTLSASLALVLGAAALPAQSPARLEIDPVRSQVWWQVNPHFGHLWGTTCPNDETWQAGEGRSTQYRATSSTGRRVRQTNVKESAEMIPLFPRDTVRANCRRGIYGTVTMAEVGDYRSVQGFVRVRADSLTIGSEMRDMFARKYVYKTNSYKEIGFSIDSLAMVQMRGDTMRGTAHGFFQLRDVRKMIAVPVYAVNDAGGLRVRGQWSITANELIEEYNVPKVYLAMGIASKLWDDLHMGFDLIFRRAAGPTDQQP